MSDIISLLGYDIRGEELRAAAEHARLVREVEEARRGGQPARRRLFGAIRERLFGAPAVDVPTTSAPPPPAPDATTDLSPDGTQIERPAAVHQEQPERLREPVGSRH